jgi:hypothetical protein
MMKLNEGYIYVSGMNVLLSRLNSLNGKESEIIDESREVLGARELAFKC